MRCKGTSKKGKRCKKTVLQDSNYCAQHDDQEPESIGPCARCGPEKEAIQEVQVGPEITVPLCMSCSISLLRTVYEFTGVEDIDVKLLEFRESF